MSIDPCVCDNWDSCFKASGRAEHAEKRLSDNRRQYKHHKDKDNIFAVLEKMGYSYFVPGYTAKQVLEETERTQVTAVETSGEYTEKTDESESKQRNKADYQEMLDGTDRTCALCERA